MPKRKKNQKFTFSKGRKRSRAVKSRARGRQYGNKRPMAIQRATAVPKTAMIKFVIDKTFLYKAPDLPSGSDPMQTGHMDVSCNNLLQPFNTGVSAGTWTAQEGASTDSVEGLTDWVGSSGGRYQKFMVLGAKIEINSVASADISTSETGQDPYTNNYAIGIHKCTTGLDDVKSSTSLPVIQKMPYTRQRNLSGALSNQAGYAKNVVQGGRLSDTYSAKRWEGVTNVKDNEKLHSTVTTTAPGIVAPAEGGKFQVFVASREPVSTGKQVPSQLMRVKVEYTALLTDPITSDNVPIVIN